MLKSSSVSAHWSYRIGYNVRLPFMIISAGTYIKPFPNTWNLQKMIFK